MKMTFDEWIIEVLSGMHSCGETTEQNLRAAWDASAKAEREAGAVEIDRLRDRIERLRGALKTASGRFFDADDLQSADDCLKWAGDMEPPLMTHNAKVTGSPALSASPRGLPGYATEDEK